jgi:hypothetical protein
MFAMRDADAFQPDSARMDIDGYVPALPIVEASMRRIRTCLSVKLSLAQRFIDRSWSNCVSDS